MNTKRYKTKFTKTLTNTPPPKKTTTQNPINFSNQRRIYMLTCKACNADVWNLIPSNRSFVKDLTILWKESFGISKFVVRWYLLISKRALELGLQFRGSFIPPVSLDCNWSLCKALKVLEILTIVFPLGASFLWTCFKRAIWSTHLSSARRKQKVELFCIGGPKKIHFRDKQRARCQTVCSIFGLEWKKKYSLWDCSFNKKTKKTRD